MKNVFDPAHLNRSIKFSNSRIKAGLKQGGNGTGRDWGKFHQIHGGRNSPCLNVKQR